MTLKEFFKNLHQNSHYICLPDSDNSGDRAMAEAFWARLAEWGIFPETRKIRVPPSAIFDEPEP
jgi:hypothetical protein